MLHLTEFENDGGASRYYFGESQAAEYYTKTIGIWGERGAARLGIPREVGNEHFKALEENRHPITGEQLTPRMNTTRLEVGINKETGEPEFQEVSNRRSGYDFCFVVPKSLSVYMALNPGMEAERLEAMILAAWQATMNDMEIGAKTRVRIGGAQEDRVTGNLVYCRFVHKEARPVDGISDPYFHIHTFILNATFDAVEDRWKAGQFGDLVKFSQTSDACFLSRLDRMLKEAGYGTRRTTDDKGRMSFELTSVSRETNDLFSRRHNLIVEKERAEKEKIEKATWAIIRDARKCGKHLDYDKVHAEQTQQLSAVTREKKSAAILKEEEKLPHWRSVVSPEMQETLTPGAVRAAPSKDWASLEHAKQEAVEEIFKGESAVNEMKVVEAVLRRCGGDITIDQAKQFAHSDHFVRLDAQGNVTTRELRDEENAMRSIVRGGWDQYEPLGGGQEWKIQDPLVAGSADQAAALRFLLESRDLVMDVSGIAGSGKSTMLKEVVMAIEERTGKSVIILAPTAPATEALREKGFKAETFQNFQDKLVLQDAAKGQIICIDEISLVSVPQVLWAVQFARENDNRIITAGDEKQHHSVERGDAIRILEDSGSVRFVELTENYRQKVEILKNAIKDLKAGGNEKLEAGYAKFKAHGAIHEVHNQAELREQAVEKHLSAIRAGHLSILGSPIHVEARETAKVVRDILKSEGLIEQENHQITRILKLDLSKAQLKDPIQYKHGRVVVFHKKVNGGFKPGEKWQVREGGENGSVVLEKDGVTRMFDPSTSGKWDVYRSEAMDLSVGDQVRVTQNFKQAAARFKNNDIFKVTAIDAEKIVLDDGRTIARGFMHLDQGHCVTSYASQCRTVYQVVPMAPLNALSQFNAKTFYTYMSRATHEMHLYTDCEPALKEAVLRPGDRKSIWEFEGSRENGQTQGVDLHPGKWTSRKQRASECLPVEMTLAQMAQSSSDKSREPEREIER
jgi:conjugative relaxase-like TrwC/TraI family protein